MRSGELAKLAGVTPRTLRHYRNIGLLPEPERRENGYCNYGAPDLIRLLRIKHLASLGFSLDTIGEMLASPGQIMGESAQARLDELDCELVLQIEELERQRQTIALLKKENLDADLPLEVSELIGLMRKSGMNEELIDSEREAFLLCTSLLDPSDTTSLTEVYHLADAQGLLEQYGALSNRIYALPSNASENERDELANETAQLFEPFMQALNLEEEYDSDYKDSAIERLILNHEAESLNAAQKDIVTRAFKKLAHTFPEFVDIEKRFRNYA